MRRIATLTLLAVVFALASNGPVHADEVWSSVFRDDFDGSILNPEAWVVEQANGQFEVSGGFLHLRSIPSGLPQIASKPGWVPVTDGVKLRFGFQFGNTTCFGAGIGARVDGPCAGPPTYMFHRDCASGTDVVVPVPTVCGPTASTPFEGWPPAYHVGEFVFHGDSVVVFVDGEALSTTVAGRPPVTAIWFGSVGSTCCQYTEFSVDFAEVLVLSQPVPALRRSWGTLKAAYR